MRDEYFVENLSEETIINMVDKALRFEKNRREEKRIQLWLKMIPVAVCAALVIGAINLLPMIDFAIKNESGITETDFHEFASSVPKIVENDPYSHVRFGKTRDILLVEVEWHTYDTFLNEVVEPYRKQREEWRTSEYYLQWSEEEKERMEKIWEDIMQDYEKRLENNDFWGRSINGKKIDELHDCMPTTYFCMPATFPYKEGCDSDGYFKYEIYPITYLTIQYQDENGDWQSKNFAKTNLNPGTCTYSSNMRNKTEYMGVLEKEIIPFCDDLLARGLLSQEDYDFYTTFDPLDYYVKLFFD